MKVLILLWVVGIAVASWALGTSTSSISSWHFEDDTVGALPSGWDVAETRSRDTPATWQVLADTTAPSAPKTVAAVVAPNSGQTYNLLLARDTSYDDLEVEVMMKARSGKQDQGGGPLWRGQDADNYYISRWNPLEDNFRVYCVEDTRRHEIASAQVKAAPDAWHKITIKHVGCRIQAALDDVPLIDVVDSTFTQAGMIGLWTKADAVTAFDDIEARAIDGSGD